MPFARAPASRHPTGKYRKSSRTLAGRPVVSFKLLTGQEERGSAQPTAPLRTCREGRETFRIRCISRGDPPPDKPRHRIYTTLLFANTYTHTHIFHNNNIYRRRFFYWKPYNRLYIGGRARIGSITGNNIMHII